MRSGGDAAAPAAAAPAAAAPAAAAPAAAAPDAAKEDVYNSWDPNAPRSPNNFNPFETWDGNSPDCSGFYPGEGRYKDPARPDVSYQTMMAEREKMEARKANPKPGDVPGCPGCRN